MIYIVLFEQVHTGFVDHLSRYKQGRPIARAGNVFRHGAAEDTILQWDHHLTTLNNCFSQESVSGPAVFFNDNQVLANIHQPASQITRVCRLEGGIRQPLTGAVSGNKVLVDVQALAEVRGNWGFDNGSVRLGHKTAHPSELADLCVTASGAGVRHHVDGVEGFLLNPLSVRIDHLFNAEFIHHLTRDPVAGVSPDVHHFVVPFTIG